MENDNSEVLRYDDVLTIERAISTWGHSWGLNLLRECALLGVSPGDKVRVTIEVLERHPRNDHDTDDEKTE